MKFCLQDLQKDDIKKAKICDIITNNSVKTKKKNLRQSITSNSRIWLTLTYNHTVANVKEAGNKCWDY